MEHSGDTKVQNTVGGSNTLSICRVVHHDSPPASFIGNGDGLCTSLLFWSGFLEKDDSAMLICSNASIYVVASRHALMLGAVPHLMLTV